MLSAEEAKKKALTHKKQIADNFEIKKKTAFQVQVKLLLDDFNSKIDHAVNEGLFTTVPITYEQDRFSDEVIRDVIDELSKKGYKVQKDHHNAYQKVMFVITWV